MNREFGAAVMDRRPRALLMTNIMIMATILGFWLFAIASRAPTEIAIVNKDGKRVLALDYEAASYFAEGLASVKRGGKWGFIDNLGRYVIKPQLGVVDASPFSEGFASLTVVRKWYERLSPLS